MSNKTLVRFVVLVLILLITAGIYYKNQENKKEVLSQSSESKKDNKDSETNQDVSKVNEKNMDNSMCVRNYDENKFNTEKVEIKEQKIEINVKSYGKIVIALDDKAAPKTVENFIKLTNSGFYDCLTFHRIAKGFVIQGGDPKGDGTGGPGFTIPAEIKLSHKKGSIAMARLPDQVNPKKESSGSQFYVALNDLSQLDGEYTVFGQVIEGMEVVQAIGGVKIDSTFGDGPPETPVVMESVKIIK